MAIGTPSPGTPVPAQQQQQQQQQATTPSNPPLPQPQFQPPVHPSAPLHGHSLSGVSAASTATLDIEAWTTEALASLAISPAARGTGAALSIALDEHPEPAAPRMKLRFDGAAGGTGIAPPRRTGSAQLKLRDSLKKREELVKGKEGSRARRRWENDHLLHVPNAQPPLPSDWQVRPTYPVLPTVPYAIAQYWDKGLRERVEERKAQFSVHRRAGKVVVSCEQQEVGKVPRDLRTKAKKTPAVKSWLRLLEEPVREFLVDAGVVNQAEEGGSDTEEDEEIVFVGRNGSMMDGKTFKRAQWVAKGEERAEAGMVLDTTGEGESAALRRFLGHSISEYYGLSSKSVMVGNPARRVVYIGVKHPGQRHAPMLSSLPPPLWEVFEK